jgi:hypothetical protein
MLEKDRKSERHGAALSLTGSLVSNLFCLFPCHVSTGRSILCVKTVRKQLSFLIVVKTCAFYVNRLCTSIFAVVGRISQNFFACHLSC